MEKVRETALGCYDSFSQDQKDKAFAIFEAMDSDGSGAVSLKEYEEFYGSSYRTSFQELDADGNGELDYEEFITLFYILITSKGEKRAPVPLLVTQPESSVSVNQPKPSESISNQAERVLPMERKLSQSNQVKTSQSNQVEGDLSAVQRKPSQSNQVKKVSPIDQKPSESNQVQGGLPIQRKPSQSDQGEGVLPRQRKPSDQSNQGEGALRRQRKSSDQSNRGEGALLRQRKPSDQSNRGEGASPRQQKPSRTNQSEGNLPIHRRPSRSNEVEEDSSMQPKPSQSMEGEPVTKPSRTARYREAVIKAIETFNAAWSFGSAVSSAASGCTTM